MRYRVLSMAAALLLVSHGGWAQPQTQTSSATPAGAANGPESGEVEVGAQVSGIDGDEARYQRYRDDRNGVFSNLRFSRQTESYMFDASLRKAGFRDQRYAASYRGARAWFDFTFTGMPLNYSFMTRTPYMRDGSTLTLEPPEGFDISSHIACGGCSCICKCLCISVLSQAPDGTVTIVGTNEVVCGVVETASVSNCAGTRTAQVSSGSWTTYEGWQVILPGGAEGPPESCTVSTGTEVSYAPCTLPAILYFADEEIHIINAASGDVVAVYQWNIEDRTPIRVSWVGYVLGEAATAYFQAYNWSTTAWDALGSQAGQAAAGWKFQRYQLGADYVGTGVNEGIVKIRVSAENATSLSTDMLRLQTTRCCKLELLPPVEPAETLTKCDLSDPSNCPTVFHAWQFEDVDGVLWYVSIDCAWCGSQCGSVFTACCDRPVPRTLFAEVTVDCPSCITTFVVPLLANEAGSIWDGSGLMCTEPFSLSLSCDGTTWHIQTTAGPGACSFSGDATTAECEPLYLVFSGFYAGGIGCCGFGSMDTMVAITIVVFE